MKERILIYSTEYNYDHHFYNQAKAAIWFVVSGRNMTEAEIVCESKPGKMALGQLYAIDYKKTVVCFSHGDSRDFFYERLALFYEMIDYVADADKSLVIILRSCEDGLSRLIEEASEIMKIPLVIHDLKSSSTEKNDDEQGRKHSGLYRFSCTGKIIDLLALDEGFVSEVDEVATKQAETLEKAMQGLDVNCKVVNICCGPAFKRFETEFKGVKVSEVYALKEDIQMALAAYLVRIEVVPGKMCYRIEIPNEKRSVIRLRSILDTENFTESSLLQVGLGRDILGNPIYCDIAKMPSILIAGNSGSGKSICINTILVSIISKASPDEVRLILIDPKVVELSVYNGIPHLITPVISDYQEVLRVLESVETEMDRRYSLFVRECVRDIKQYNEHRGSNVRKKLSIIVIVIDEIADLMIICRRKFQELLSRLTAKGRAAGIHLIVATQRPCSEVISETIDNSFPSRISFTVDSEKTSQLVLGRPGAEALYGCGDMLYYPSNFTLPVRVQGAFVSDDEVEAIVSFLKSKCEYNTKDKYESLYLSFGRSNSNFDNNVEDKVFCDAVDLVISEGIASVSLLQRRLGIGYPHAARIIDKMEKMGYVGPFLGSKPREVLIDKDEWERIKGEEDEE